MNVESAKAVYTSCVYVLKEDKITLEDCNGRLLTGKCCTNVQTMEGYVVVSHN